MSKNSKFKFYPFLFLVLGLLSMACRMGLYARAVDWKGLLVSHPLTPVLLVLTGLAAACAVLLTRKTQVSIPVGVPAALGGIALAAAVVVQLLNMEAMEESRFLLLNLFFSAAAAVCALVLALCHARKKQPHFGLYAVLCVFYCIHQLLCYPLWSKDPQLMDYAFSLGAVLCAILFCYGQAAQVLGMKHSRLQGAIGLFGIFCCCTAIANCEFPILYAGTALFLMTELTGLDKKKEA